MRGLWKMPKKYRFKSVKDFMMDDTDLSLEDAEEKYQDQLDYFKDLDDDRKLTESMKKKK